MANFCRMYTCSYLRNQPKLVVACECVFLHNFSLFTLKNFCLFDIDMTLHCVLTQLNCHKTPLFVFFEQPRYHLAENVTLMLGELLLKTGPSIWQQLSRMEPFAKAFKKCCGNFFSNQSNLKSALKCQASSTRALAHLA